MLPTETNFRFDKVAGFDVVVFQDSFRPPTPVETQLHAQRNELLSALKYAVEALEMHAPNSESEFLDSARALTARIEGQQ